MILFTSDNGFFHGEHRVRERKVLLYEPSIHVPLMMRWTGNRALPRGVHRKQLTMNVDYAETVLAAVGASARPERVEDGVDLLRLWRDGGLELGRDLLVDNMPGTAHFDAIRSRNYIYAEWANGARELYDLRKDPYELASQHANPAYDALKASLATRLHRLVYLLPAARAGRRRRWVRRAEEPLHDPRDRRGPGSAVRRVLGQRTARRDRLEAAVPCGGRTARRRLAARACHVRRRPARHGRPPRSQLLARAEVVPEQATRGVAPDFGPRVPDAAVVRRDLLERRRADRRTPRVRRPCRHLVDLLEDLAGARA